MEVITPGDLERTRRLGVVIDDSAGETKSLERIRVLLSNLLPVEVGMRAADGRSKATGEPGALPSVRGPAAESGACAPSARPLAPVRSSA